jgi:hypothetical protein
MVMNGSLSNLPYHLPTTSAALADVAANMAAASKIKNLTLSNR